MTGNTFLPVRPEMKVGTPLKIILGDYRPVGQVKMPFLIDTEAMGQSFRLEVETITLNEPLPPEVLDLPDEIEKLAFHPRVEIREAEADKDRPTLRHRSNPAPAK
jgi:hypothetical protein